MNPLTADAAALASSHLCFILQITRTYEGRSQVIAVKSQRLKSTFKLLKDYFALCSLS